MKKLIISGLITILCLFFFQENGHAQDCTFGDLNAQNLSYSPGGFLNSCRKVSVTAEWLQQGQNPYVVAEHQSTLIVSLPIEFVGTTGTLSVTATDANIYWIPGAITLTDSEIQIPLTGIIPSGEAISITLSGMDINITDPFALFNISQSISLTTIDCDSENDDQTIGGGIQNTAGPAVTDIQASCTGTDLAIDLTVQQGGGNIDSYSWSGPNGFSSMVEDPSFMVAAVDKSAYTGTYEVMVTDINGCTVESSIDMDGVNCLALPVELLNFDAYPGNNEVTLKWETATELNNSHFDVERSPDGRNFTKIGEVKGHGTTSTVIKYGITDNNPLQGKSYYRLKQIDFDGTIQYSHIEEVTFGEAANLKLFPNPVAPGSEFSIRSQKISSVKIYNMLGQLMIEELYKRPQTQVTLSSANLSQGLYVARVNDADEIRVLIK